MPRNKGMGPGIRPWLFLAPSLTGTAVFFLIPFGDMVFRSFRKAVGPGFVGLSNFRQVWDNGAFRLAAGNTLRFMIVCIPLLMVCSLWIAILVRFCARSARKIWMGRKVGPGGGSPGGSFPAASVFKTSILLPMAIPVASVVLFWKLVFYPQGLLSQLVVLPGGQSRDWLNRPGVFYILVATYLWKNTGYDMMLWLAGLNGIAGELYEAARVDGAGAWQCFYYVTLPGLKGTAFLTAVLSTINSFKVFREAYLVAGDYPHESIYMLQHLFNNWFVSLDIQKMSAASVMIETAVLIPVLACLMLRKKQW